MTCFKLNTTLFLLFLALISICSQCKDLDCREQVFNFEIGIKAYPDKDSIHINDTIWLEVDEPTTQIDVITGRTILFSGASNLSSTIGIAELISINNVDTKGNTFFDFLLLSGTEIIRSDSNSFREYKFKEANNKYQLLVGVIPKKKGIFKLFVSNATSVIRKNDKCAKASFIINFRSTNQHLYFNEIVLPGVTLPTGGGVYLFKVY